MRGVEGPLSPKHVARLYAGGSTKSGPSTSPTKRRAPSSTLSGRRQRSTSRRWKPDRRDSSGSASGSAWAWRARRDGASHE